MSVALTEIRKERASGKAEEQKAEKSAEATVGTPATENKPEAKENAA